MRRATDGKEAQALGTPLAYWAVGGVVESEREASAFGFSSAPVAAATARGWQSCRHEAARAASEADPAAGGAGAGADARPSARAPPPGSAAHVGVQVSGVPDRGSRGNGGEAGAPGDHVRPGPAGSPVTVALGCWLGARRVPAQGDHGPASPGCRCRPR